jgi:two-component system chemotaxis sensor kinase CheA
LLAQFQTVGSGYRDKVRALFEQMPRFLEEIQNGASVRILELL